MIMLAVPTQYGVVVRVLGWTGSWVQIPPRHDAYFSHWNVAGKSSVTSS